MCATCATKIKHLIEILLHMVTLSPITKDHYKKMTTNVKFDLKLGYKIFILYKVEGIRFLIRKLQSIIFQITQLLVPSSCCYAYTNTLIKLLIH